jgi:amidase
MSARATEYESAVEIGRQIKIGAVSSKEVTAHILERIQKYDDRLKSYIAVFTERALKKAVQADAEIARGLWRGPLHGVPIAVKDLCNTTFGPTSAGMAIHANHVPDHNATVVDRLEQAGAVILGKLSMTEGAFAGHHPDMPTPVNPWNNDYWTGASSSGSGVATASGLCYGSLGSDTGGSIRLPSGACGLTGVKPTWGRVSRYGVAALAESLDHIGPMARNAADAAAMLAAIAGADVNDPTALPAPVPDYLGGLGKSLRGLRIGLDEAYVYDGTDPEIVAAIGQALEAFASLGARIVPIRFPPLGALGKSWMQLCALEAAIFHEATYPSRAAEYGPVLAGLLDQGLALSAFDLGKAQLARAAFSGKLAQVFLDVDMLVAPVIPMLVPTSHGFAKLADEGLDALIKYTGPFDMTGNPTVTLNGGFDSHGVPIGFQLVGRHLSEEMLLSAGHAFQQVTDWHCRHPALAAAKVAERITA